MDVEFQILIYNIVFTTNKPTKVLSIHIMVDQFIGRYCICYCNQLIEYALLVTFIIITTEQRKTSTVGACC